MYQSLYRKYRPKKFCDLVGQNSIIKILKNSIINNKISHAYLFSGPRGTGKTSTAKIFAKAVNCLNLIDGECCDDCENCREIALGTAVDIIEIDAASNNGVEEIRELRNNINLACSSLKYKVYIVDEVHMLSTGAFNALLKTLEEPPEHVIFILATTDPQKVPSTIVSRCQCFGFGQISINNIKLNLKNVCKNENINISDEILEKISLYSNGGMRDALGLLEKVSLYGKDISIDEFNDLCGYIGDKDLNDFIDALFMKNSKVVVDIITSKYLNGVNLIVFFNQVIEKIRTNLLSDIADTKKTRINVRYIEVLNNVCINIKNSDNPHAVAIALLLNELLESGEKKVEDPILESNNDANKRDGLTEQNIIVSKEEESLETLIDNDIIINNTFVSASKKKLADLKKEWSKLNEYILDNTYGSNASFLLDASICAVGDNNFIVSFEYDSLVNRARGMYDDLVNTLKELLNIDDYVAFISSSDWMKIKKDYINKIKNGGSYEFIDKNPILRNKNKKVENNGSTEQTEADIIFGDDIVEYE